MKPAKRERKVSDTSDEETEEDLDDEDYKVNMDDMGAEWKYMSSDFSRSYATRRNAKIQQSKISFLTLINVRCIVSLLVCSTGLLLHFHRKIH